MSYLDNNGLLYFWKKIKAAMPTKTSQLTNDSGFLTSIDGISLNVEQATKAFQDGNGNVITSTYAPISSPALSGTPTAPTATAGTNTTQLATTAFVTSAVTNLINSAPATLNTLNELATALGNDPNFATTVTTSLSNKLDSSEVTTIATANKILRLNENAQLPANISGNAATASKLAAAYSINDTPFNGTASIKVNKLKWPTDTRSVATAPNDYNSSFTFVGLKNNSYIGTPESSNYSYVIGLRGYSDSSGGVAHELAYSQNGNIYQRYGSTDTWGSWRQFAFTNDNVASATKLQTARTIGLSGVAATSQSFDGSANITIPITAVPATLLTGTASISTTGNAGTVNGKTVLSNVPANAVFTDTIYTHPISHPASMITGLATVATSGNYADLSNIPNSLPANGGTADSANTLTTARTIGLSGVTATAQSFNGSANITIPITTIPATLLTGTASISITGDSGTVNGKTILSNVPENAVFTDTIYTHPISHPASMITGLASVAISGDYTNLINKPTSLPANGGAAESATKDGSGNVITTTYATKTELNNVGATIPTNAVKTINNTAPDANGNINISIEDIQATFATSTDLTSHNTDGSAHANIVNELMVLIAKAKLDSHPIGSLYFTNSAEDPSITFGGGTWVRIKDKFIYAAGDSSTIDSTGGEATHTLTAAEMPAHSHGISTSGDHSHYFYGSDNNNGPFTEGDGLDTQANSHFTRNLRFATSSAGDHTHTISNSGDGTAHNNMPPFIVKYCWERTA